MVRHAENRGVANVGLQIFVERNLHALLAGFDVIGFGDARTPVMVAVVADQIGDRRAGHGGGEDSACAWRGSGVEAAPGMAHDADFVSSTAPFSSTFFTAAVTQSATERPGFALRETRCRAASRK